jgi:hypothetical protein
LLWLGPAPAPPFRPRPRLPVGARSSRLRTWLAAHYPWGADWPGRTLPLLEWPATAMPDTSPLDTMAAYHLPPPATLAGPAEAPYLELGISSTTGAPIRVSAGTQGSAVAAIWRGHFLSLGIGPQRFGPLAHLAQQAYMQGRAIFALDPQQHLLPALQDVLLDPALRPAWITRQHPRSSVRLNLLAVPPAPGPDRSAEIGALYLALTSALPLFEQFLARLGLAPWSTLTGGVLIHDLALGLLLQHHRARIAGDPPPPPPTPAAIYEYLHTGPDVRALLTAEGQAWVKLAQAQAPIEGQSAATGETCALACTQLAAGVARWEAGPLAAQQETRDSIRALLQPLFEAPGFKGLWQAPTAPSAYFNGAPAPLTLTQIVPPDATERDRIFARWYSEYLLLTVIAAAQARRFAGGTGPPLLVLLDDLRGWSQSILPAARLETLGAGDIACAVVGTHLPAAPDGEQILRSTGTWWLHTPAPWDQPTIAPYLAAIQPGAGDLPLVHFPPDLALLRTTIPAPGLATVMTAPAEAPTAAAGAA